MTEGMGTCFTIFALGFLACGIGIGLLIWFIANKVLGL